jgi:hypothetical protein
MPKRDLLGQRFGKLTVVGENPVKYRNSKVMWDCTCDCGGKKTVMGSSLTKGVTNSCGCLVSKNHNVDFTGQRFGRLVVQKRVEGVGRKKIWECLCDCGVNVVLRETVLTSGNTKSCGCLNMEKLKTGEMAKTHGHCVKGGESLTYIKWCSMKQRVKDTNNPKSAKYIERGIKVCERWLNSFENFLEDLGECPSSAYSLERIDPFGDYCPENCKWIPLAEQARNTVNTKRYTFNRESLILNEWEAKTGIKSATIRKRVEELGWSMEKALTTPPRGRGSKKPLVV